MANLVTLCFYENPAALHEIKAWEQTKIKEIIAKREFESGIINYLIQRSPMQMEVLICYPHTFARGMFNPFCNEITKLIKSGDFYHKTLLFGKFNSRELGFIKSMVETLENYNA